MDAKVNDLFLDWLKETYGKIGEIKTTRGKMHTYLGMIFDYRTKGKVQEDIQKYMSKMLTDFEKKYVLSSKTPAPASIDLFKHNKTAPTLDKEMSKDFHTFTAKGLFAAKRGRPDRGTPISVLSTRVRKPNTNNWDKLVRMMQYIKRTKDEILTLWADSLHVIKWYVDSSFAVHPDFKSHSGAVMTMGEGAIQSASSKQKLNTRSSCEAELIAVDDMAHRILWSKLFMEAQGYRINKNILYQDNKSTIILHNNGRKSVGKRSRALNIRYFFIADQCEKGNIEVQYCPRKRNVG